MRRVPTHTVLFVPSCPWTGVPRGSEPFLRSSFTKRPSLPYPSSPVPSFCLRRVTDHQVPPHDPLLPLRDKIRQKPDPDLLISLRFLLTLFHCLHCLVSERGRLQEGEVLVRSGPDISRPGYIFRWTPESELHRRSTYSLTWNDGRDPGKCILKVVALGGGRTLPPVTQLCSR